MKNYNVIDFRFANREDEYDIKYGLENIWSRPYEYKYVIDFIKKTNINNPKIHNTSWGFEGVHIIFKNELELLGNTLSSDIRKSNENNTIVYDITKPYFKESEFDFVINVSTIEHLDHQLINQTIYNLYNQVKLNGYLILTFDYPRINVTNIENLINYKCNMVDIPLNGSNSIVKNLNYKDLNIVYLIIKKNE